MYIMSSLYGALGGAQILGIGITHYKAMPKKFRTLMINICLFICIIVFARCVYLELLLESSRRELVFGQKYLGFYIFGS